MHSEKTIIHKLQNHHCIFALKHSKQRYTKQLRDMQPHGLGSSSRTAWPTPSFAPFHPYAQPEVCHELQRMPAVQRFSWKPKSRPRISDEQRNHTTSASIRPRPGRDFPRSLRRLTAGLRSFPRPQPPLPLRSAVRAHLAARPPSSNPPPAPAAAVRRLPAARPVGAAPPLGTCEEGAGCVPAGRPGVRHGA